MTMEPTRMEILLTRAAGRTLLAPLYRTHVERLGLQGHERVLDFGSGSGLLSHRITHRLSRGGSLTCLDVSGKWLEEAGRTLSEHRDVELIHGDLPGAGLPLGSYDVVSVHFVLHDIPECRRPSVVAGLGALLCEGGRLVVREPATPAIGLETLASFARMGGLSESVAFTEHVPFLGPVISATYVKEAATHRRWLDWPLKVA